MDHHMPYPCRWNLVLQNPIPVASDRILSFQKQPPKVTKFHFRTFGSTCQTLIKWNLVFSVEFNFTYGI